MIKSYQLKSKPNQLEEEIFDTVQNEEDILSSLFYTLSHSK